MSVLYLDILKLFSGMRENDDGSCNLLPQLVKLLVPLLDLLIESLVLNLELLEVNQM